MKIKVFIFYGKAKDFKEKLDLMKSFANFEIGFLHGIRSKNNYRPIHKPVSLLTPSHGLIDRPNKNKECAK